MKKNETMYIIFNVSDGPKVITETLNTKGQDGWWLATAINVEIIKGGIAILKLLPLL